jgi:large subunit ribosomal protein L29
MDLKELRQMTGAELSEKAKQLSQELFNLRFQLGTGRLENPMQIRKTKRSIAQVKTVQREVEQVEKKRRPSGERVKRVWLRA